MNTNRKTELKAPVITALLAGITLGFSYQPTAIAAEVPLSTTPLFLQTPSLPNVLVILDNSNSMDEAANGSAVGSDDPNSKSEIARTAVRNLITAYTGKINMGLMAYQQATNQSRNIDNSPYDISFDSTNYDPTFSGTPRNSTTKRFRLEQVDNPGNYVYYNVALPFYHTGGSTGDTSYCYSTTANAFNNGETPPTYNASGTLIAYNGPWDTYRCFEHKTGASDVLADAAGYNSHLFNSFFFPTDSDLAQGITDFGSRMHSVQIGPTWFANSSPGRGYLHTAIAELNLTQAATLNTKLNTSQFTNNEPTNSGYPLQNAGLTPLEGTLLTANDYFGGSWAVAAEGSANRGYPLPESCGFDYTILVTDGLPSVNVSGAGLTGDAAANIIPATAAAATLAGNGIKTYVVGFALPFGIPTTLLDNIASAGGTDTAYDASDSTALQTALDDIFGSIELESSSAASVALNTTSWSDESRLFQAKFNSTDWSGDLLSYPVNADGTLASATHFSTLLESQDPDLDDATGSTTGNIRHIITSSSGAGVSFRWDSLNSTQQTLLNTDPATGATDTPTALGNKRVDFIRGAVGDASFRTRTSKLGDLINSAPYYVDGPAFGYPNDLETAAYGDFRATYFNRTPMLYIGGNDGMLHGFNADQDDSSNEGKELIAYVPEKVYKNLNQLTSPSYAHQYYVDGSPTVGDTFYSSAWHTTLVGGLNAGGQGYYALDITNPSNFSEANASSLVLWEFTDANDADLGYTFSEPSIVKMANDQWVAIFGNGYNNTDADGNASTTGHAVLFIVDIATGTLLKKIDTEVGTVATPNGLSTPATVDIDGDHVVDYIYAGDLYGNMWKFDVTATNPNSWGSAYMTSPPGAVPTDLFSATAATDGTGVAQPITSRPEVSRHPTESGYMVYFGTGKYLGNIDNTSTDTQTFYGIWDSGSANIAKNTLLEQITVETTGFGFDLRVVSDRTIDWTSHRGWFIDLPTSKEKQVTNSILRNGKIIFTTLIPSILACEAGGTGWLMEVNASNGGRVEGGVFDLNNDGTFTDYVTVTIDGAEVTTSSSGKKSTVGILPSPAILTKGNKEFKYASGSTGEIEVTTEKSGGASGRVSWKQLSVQ